MPGRSVFSPRNRKGHYRGVPLPGLLGLNLSPIQGAVPSPARVANAPLLNVHGWGVSSCKDAGKESFGPSRSQVGKQRRPHKGESTTTHYLPAILTGTRMQRLGSHHQRRAHRVEGKFFKVVAGLLGEDLIDHESLVAPPGCFELAG